MELVQVRPETQDATVGPKGKLYSGDWSRQRLEYEAAEDLEMFDKENIHRLHYGEQYGILPHIVCHQCGKVIGDKWLPYLEKINEKRYKPEEVIKLLYLTEDQESELLMLLEEDRPTFYEMLKRYNVKSDFDRLYQTAKYTIPQIYKDLQLKNACCREKMQNPIHVPIKRSAFEEKIKSKQILSPLEMMDVNTIGIQKPSSEEGPSSSSAKNIRLPLIPSILSVTEAELSCKSEIPPLETSSFRSTIVIPNDIPDDLLDISDAEDVLPVGEAVEKRRTMISVGEGYQVPLASRKYRAR